MVTKKSSKKTTSAGSSGRPRETLPDKAASLKLQEPAEPIIKTAQDLAIVARYISESGFFPELNEVAKAAVVVQAGRELGIQPIMAGQLIHPIKTTSGIDLAIEAKVLGAIAMDNGIRWKIHKKDAAGCKLEFYSIRDKTIPHHTETFTIEDAKRAGLDQKKNWLWYPEEMCYNRCLAKGLRVFDPRIGLGFYTKEEVIDFEPIQEAGEEEEVYVMKEEDAEVIPEAETAPDQTVAETHPATAAPPGTTQDIKKAEDLGLSQHSEEEQEEETLPPEEKPGDDFMPFDGGPTPEELEEGKREIGEPAPVDPDILRYKQIVLDFLKVQGMQDLYSMFKEWLARFQTSRKPMRKFVSREAHGHWSIEKGDKEDLKVLCDNLKWTVDKFIEYCWTDLKMEKVGFYTNPQLKEEDA